MGPPSLLVGFGKGQPVGQPDECVVVQSAALLQLCYPHLAKTNPAPLQPLADAFEQFGDVTRLEPVDLSIGEGEHGGLDSKPSKAVLEQLGRDQQGSLQAGVPGFVGVDLYRVR